MPAHAIPASFNCQAISYDILSNTSRIITTDRMVDPRILLKENDLSPREALVIGYLLGYEAHAHGLAVSNLTEYIPGFC